MALLRVCGHHEFRTSILGAYATSADPLLKNRGAQELPDEEMWRDFACVKVLLFARYIF